LRGCGTLSLGVLLPVTLLLITIECHLYTPFTLRGMLSLGKFEKKAMGIGKVE